MSLSIAKWRSGATLMLAGALTLTGCAGQETPSSRYTLPEPARPTNDMAMMNDTATTNADASILVVRPVAVASYLNQEGIVMQMSDIELNAANQNLWAEALGRQLTRRLSQSLSQRLEQTTVVGSGQTTPGARALSVDVESFQGRYDGRAVASGEWQLFDDDRLVIQRRFEVTRPLSEDGYPALVHTLGDVWGEVAEQIAEALPAGE